MTFRADWNSSLWTAGAITYPTVGLSGIVTELIPALKSKFFPYWKIRASYSEVGNSPDPSLYLLDAEKRVILKDAPEDYALDVLSWL